MDDNSRNRPGALAELQPVSRRDAVPNERQDQGECQRQTPRCVADLPVHVLRQHLNRPILERRHVSTIDPHLLASLQANDPDLSRRLAFEKVRRNLKMEHFDDATVRKEVASQSARPACRLEIVCVVPETTGLRVDRLLSTELRLSRSRIQSMQNAGHLEASPEGLRRPLRNGLHVRIDLRGVHDGDEIALAAMGGEA